MRKAIQIFNERQEMKSDKFEIFHYKDANTINVPLHHHDFYEIFLFLNGNVDYRVESEVYHLKPGDLLFCPPGVFHQPIISPDKTYERVVIWMTCDYIKSITKQYGKEPFINTHHIFSANSRLDNVLNICSTLDFENKNADNYTSAYTSNFLSILLIEIMRMAKQTKIINTSLNKNLLINKILSYINENYHDDLSLDDLANHFYLNKYYLSHLFSDAVGTSIYQYIKKKRLVLAYELLNNGYSPSDACVKCGFKEYTNFLKAYKEEYKVTPKYHYAKH